jgi:hypothetical protein
MNRRKSLGDIWGSISSRVSPRRDAALEGRRPDWYNNDPDLTPNTSGENDPISMSGALDPAAGPSTVPNAKQDNARFLTQPPKRDSKLSRATELIGSDIVLYRWCGCGQSLSSNSSKTFRIFVNAL